LGGGSGAQVRLLPLAPSSRSRGPRPVRSNAARASGVPISSQACCTAWNRIAAPPVSGCVSRSIRRYAWRSWSWLAVVDTPSTS
jgi:hypothetical protein